MLLLLRRLLLGGGGGRQFGAGLGRILMPDRHAFLVQQRALFLRVLRRNAVAVVNDALVIHPLVGRRGLRPRARSPHA